MELEQTNAQTPNFEPSKSLDNLRQILKTPATNKEEIKEEVLLAAQEQSNEEPKIHLSQEEINHIVQKHVQNKQRTREYKREYMRRKNQERKEYVARLEEKQIRGCSIQMVLWNNQITNHTLNSEAKYIEFINSLLGTLQDNKIVLEYNVRNENLLRE